MKLEFDAVSENELCQGGCGGFRHTAGSYSSGGCRCENRCFRGVTNAIIHGYADWGSLGQGPGKVVIRCCLNEDVLHIEVEDKGRGIEDVEKAMEPLYTTRPDMDRSGMGFAFMEAFMDDLDVESEPGKGTLVKMEKKLGTLSWTEDEE